MFSSTQSKLQKTTLNPILISDPDPESPSTLSESASLTLSTTSLASSSSHSSSSTSTIMDIFPLIILLIMGIVISSTCGRYSYASGLSSASSNHHSQVKNQNQYKHQELLSDDGLLRNLNYDSHSHHDDDDPQSDSPLTLLSSSPLSSTSYSFLRRVMLNNSSVTCNDGTVAGYYIRRSFGSRRWIVFLEGGWFCFSAITCHQRWLRMRNLMTSAHWPEAKTVSGILSSSPDENPFWWNANHVFIPYCSSDLWSGDSPANSPGELSFLGARIVQQVITELLPRGLADAKLLILAGSSAGGLGVMLNLDKIAKLMSQAGSKAEVRGLSDSGWFLDNQFLGHQATQSSSQSNLNSKPCVDHYNCAPLDGIKAAYRFWKGQVPESCQQQYPDEPWRCYFGYRIYSSLKAPLFVFQWLYDEAQMHINRISSPQSQTQWQFVNKIGIQLRSTLENVTAVFAPSCVAHVILIKSDWNQIKINGISLPQAIRCWELHHTESNTNHHFVNNEFHGIQTLLADSPNQQNHQNQQHQRRKKKKRKHKDARRRHKIKRDQINQKKNNNNHNHNNHNNHHNHNHHFHHQNRFDGRWSGHERCHHWLVDECNFPQCNKVCPKLHKGWLD